MNPYLTIGTPAEAEFTERKSRFIGAICPVQTEQEATAFVREKKTLHWQATHNCWAYILKDTGAMRYNDDGEPQGTAGIPILEVLKKEALFDICLVVTRYYGGIQLGAGGLIRAYSQGATVAINAGGRVTMAPCVVLSLSIPYPLYDKALALFANYTLAVLATQYTDCVTITLRLHVAEQEQLQAAITELSAGTISLTIIEHVFAPL